MADGLRTLDLTDLGEKIRKNDVDGVRKLVEADLEYMGYSVLMITAMHSGGRSILKTLAKEFPSRINQRSSRKLKGLAKTLGLDVDKDIMNDKRFTPLMLAVMFGTPGTVKALLDSDVLVDCMTKKGFTAKMFAGCREDQSFKMLFEDHTGRNSAASISILNKIAERFEDLFDVLKGKTAWLRSRLMIVGKGRSGKTTLYNSLRGIAFDANIKSTVLAEIDGVDVKDVSVGNTFRSSAHQNNNYEQLVAHGLVKRGLSGFGMNKGSLTMKKGLRSENIDPPSPRSLKECESTLQDLIISFMRNLFKAFARDENGNVPTATATPSEQMGQLLDTNNDGIISVEEWESQPLDILIFPEILRLLIPHYWMGFMDEEGRKYLEQECSLSVFLDVLEGLFHRTKLSFEDHVRQIGIEGFGLVHILSACKGGHQIMHSLLRVNDERLDINKRFEKSLRDIPRLVQIPHDSKSLVEHLDDSSFTPLMIATLFDNTKAMEYLIYKGADTSLRTQQNKTALDLAKTEKACSILRTEEREKSDLALLEELNSIKENPVLSVLQDRRCSFNEKSLKMKLELAVKGSTLQNISSKISDLIKVFRDMDPTEDGEITAKHLNRCIPELKGHLTTIVQGQEQIGKQVMLEKTKKLLGASKDEILKNFNPIKFESAVKDQPYHLSVWDFAGQEVFYTAHTLFLVRNCTYIVVFSLKDMCASDSTREVALAFLMFWFQSIRTYAKGATFAVVGTHLDHLNNQSKSHEVIAQLRQVNISINRLMKDIFSLDAERTNCAGERLLCRFPQDSKEAFCFFPVDNTKSGEDVSVQQLRHAIAGRLKTDPFANEQVPVSWAKVCDSLLAKKNASYLPLQEIEAVASKAGIPKADVKMMLKKFHDLGMMIYYDEKYLAEYAILKPKFLIERIKRIIYDRKLHQSITHDIEKVTKMQTEWQAFFHKGILDKKLLKLLWKDFDHDDSGSNELLDSSKNREGKLHNGLSRSDLFVVNLLEKYMLLGNYGDDDKYIVPSMLPKYPDESRTVDGEDIDDCGTDEDEDEDEDNDGVQDGRAPNCAREDSVVNCFILEFERFMPHSFFEMLITRLVFRLRQPADFMQDFDWGNDAGTHEFCIDDQSLTRTEATFSIAAGTLVFRIWLPVATLLVGEEGKQYNGKDDNIRKKFPIKHLSIIVEVLKGPCAPVYHAVTLLAREIQEWPYKGNLKFNTFLFPTTKLGKRLKKIHAVLDTKFTKAIEGSQEHVESHGKKNRKRKTIKVQRLQKWERFFTDFVGKLFFRDMIYGLFCAFRPDKKGNMEAIDLGKCGGVARIMKILFPQDAEARHRRACKAVLSRGNHDNSIEFSEFRYLLWNERPQSVRVQKTFKAFQFETLKWLKSLMERVSAQGSNFSMDSKVISSIMQKLEGLQQGQENIIGGVKELKTAIKDLEQRLKKDAQDHYNKLAKLIVTVSDDVGDQARKTPRSVLIVPGDDWSEEWNGIFGKLKWCVKKAGEKMDLVRRYTVYILDETPMLIKGAQRRVLHKTTVGFPGETLAAIAPVLKYMSYVVLLAKIGAEIAGMNTLVRIIPDDFGGTAEDYKDLAEMLGRMEKDMKAMEMDTTEGKNIRTKLEDKEEAEVRKQGYYRIAKILEQRIDELNEERKKGNIVVVWDKTQETWFWVSREGFSQLKDDRYVKASVGDQVAPIAVDKKIADDIIDTPVKSQCCVMM